MVDTKDLLQPKCKRCGKDLLLVVQIYCPLVNSLYHRTLYVFGCSERDCWNKAERFEFLSTFPFFIFHFSRSYFFKLYNLGSLGC